MPLKRYDLILSVLEKEGQYPSSGDVS
jgi:hypothetical protein